MASSVGVPMLKIKLNLTALIERRIKSRADSDHKPTWLRGSPFRGLSVYEFQDADIFFGRDGPIREASLRELASFS